MTGGDDGGQGDIEDRVSIADAELRGGGVVGLVVVGAGVRETVALDEGFDRLDFVDDPELGGVGAALSEGGGEGGTRFGVLGGGARGEVLVVWGDVGRTLYSLRLTKNA